MKDVEEFNAIYKAYNVPLRIVAAGTAKMYSKENRRHNYDYKYLESDYDLLQIDSFIKDYHGKLKFRGKYIPGDIFEFLVLFRTLRLDSKHATFQLKNDFYGMVANFMLPDIYRSLNLFAGFELELQHYLNECIKEAVGRDLSHPSMMLSTITSR